MRRLAINCAVIVLLTVVASPIKADFILSTTSTEGLGGLTLRDGDLAEYNPVANTATLFFSEGLFSSGEDVDAVHVLDNGHIILSTESGATLGGLSFRDGDLVEYDPVTDTASLFFDEGLFCDGEDIAALSVLPSGNLILSTESSARLGGLSFRDGDLVEYNPLTNTASLFFSEDLFSCGEDIDAVHVLANGNIILSTEGGARLGGLTFEDGDIVKYDPATNTTTLSFDEDRLQCNDEDVDAVHVPEPATIAVLGLGSLILLYRRRG